jgi:2-polyprenyl-6-hydroxyphenyl methylase/3-demethylubiquinone-9 3-methyltransferase
VPRYRRSVAVAAAAETMSLKTSHPAEGLGPLDGRPEKGDEDLTTRFEFGKNWQRFLSVLDEERIAQAELSLKQMLGVESLQGKTFLDVGSGSGLFSLAAVRLGAARVRSLDYDPGCVACTAEVKKSYQPGARGWTVEHASILDRVYVAQLGAWDVVYAWGVLHHTGDMWRALENAAELVAPQGKLFVSIYNDQGLRSRAWRHIKRTYVTLPGRAKLPFAIAIALPMELLTAGRYALTLHPFGYLHSWTGYKRRARGMSRWHDLIDWIGGYPFEVAKPEDVFGFCCDRGFELSALVTRGGCLGCNEFVFTKK